MIRIANLPGFTQSRDKTLLYTKPTRLWAFSFTTKQAWLRILVA